MKIDKIVVAVASAGAAAWAPAHAYEAGAAGWAQMPGITLGGSSAEAPPPGLYIVLNPHGTTTGVPSAVGAAAFVWVSGLDLSRRHLQCILGYAGWHVRGR